MKKQDVVVSLVLAALLFLGTLGFIWNKAEQENEKFYAETYSYGL